MKTTGNTILITGGGSGIGEALAQRFHDQGNVVIIAGRRLDALQAASAGRDNMHARVLDVESAEGVATFVEGLLADFPNLNVLVNNAGIMRYERLDRARDLSDAEATLVTNVLGPIRLIDALVEHLVARGDGAIVNVTSGLAFVPLPGTATYSATKAAMHSYTQSLREMLRGRVEVIELAPPAVQTDLTPGQRTREGYQPLDEFADEVIALFAQDPTPEEVLVERVKGFRTAEADGTHGQFIGNLSALSTKMFDQLEM
ncbi:MAG TPA: SDR family oxidoreductase [Novosphingobium sp.]|nr:SDR family oxidoreductase [Novosphingobium sp.]